MSRMFYKWRKIDGGVRKYYEWGYSEVYNANVVDCFTKEELIQVTLELDTLMKLGCVSVGSKPLLQRCKDKLKEVI